MKESKITRRNFLKVGAVASAVERRPGGRQRSRTGCLCC